MGGRRMSVRLKLAIAAGVASLFALVQVLSASASASGSGTRRRA